MSNHNDTPRSLLHRLGVAGPARVRACKGTGARIAVLFTIVAGVTAFVATPAFAGKQYIAGASFGVKGAGAGQLEDPDGIAVSEAGANKGDVYVADTGNRRIDVFTSSGAFVMAFGKNVGGLGEDTCTVTCVAGESGSEPGAFTVPRFVAVDQTTGDLYVGDTGDEVITRFSESGAYEAQLTGTCENKGEAPPSCAGFTPFGALAGVAVDPAGGLWVREIGEVGRVDEFSDTGVFGKTFPTAESNKLGLAVDSSGGVYVAGTNFAEKYESGIKVSEFSFATTALAVNLATNNVLAFQSEEVGTQQSSNDIQLYPPFAEPPSPVEMFAAEGLSPSNGIAVSGAEAAGYPLYVTQPATDTVATFDYLQLPAVTTEPASNVEIKQQAGHGSVVATLNGEVNPNGLPVTKCVFEYGTTTAYGKIPPCHPDAKELGSGTAVELVSAEIANLLPSTTYHYRLRAANQNDEPNQPNPGLDESFPTPGPRVVSEAPAAEVKAATATLSGVVNPGGLSLSKCEFEYGTKAELKASGLYEHSAPCEAPDAAEVGAGTLPVAVHANLRGLHGGTTYSFRLVASTEVFATKEQVSVAGVGQELTTLTVPVVAGGEAVNVTAGSAELKATVNPEGLQVSHCAFEYGTSTAYEESEPCAPNLKQIGHGGGFVAVSATISELQPNTTYHWRLSVRDKNGEAFAVDHTFVYPTTTTTSELPDHRAYELVTPPFKNGALIGVVFGGFKYGISADGSRAMGISIQCFDSEETCTGARLNQGEPFAFTRTSAGWVTTPLAPPQQLKENTTWLASADEGTALFSAPTGPQHEDEWWARAAGGAFTALGPATPPGVSGIEPFKELQQQATADLSHVVWEQGIPSSKQNTFWPFDKTEPAIARTSLYEYAGTANKEPFLVGVTGGEYNTGSSERNNELISTCGTILGSKGSTSGALSGDGRTVYFTANDIPSTENGQPPTPCLGGTGVNAGEEVPVNELYARVDGEEPDAHTVAISEPQALAPSVGAECESIECKQNTSVSNERSDWRNAIFWGASTDGSRGFFTSEQQLTDNATQGSDNLYESACTKECEKAGEERELIDVSQGPGGAPVPGGPRVQGLEGISADGSHVYFVAQGTLTATPNAEGQTARSGADNLYLYESDERYPQGHLAFIATLPNYTNGVRGEEEHWSTLTFANVTPDGRFLVFASYGDLTPDTHSAGAQQIFRYDAATEALVRISVGDEGYGDDGNAGTGNAAIVPPYEAAHAGSPRGDPTMSDDGSYVFFMSPLALTPHALNDAVAGEEQSLPIYAQNVYEWHEGHVYLISDGHDTSVADSPCEVEEATHGSASCLLGSDASGHNVFFETTDRLVPKDTDTQVDIYDARICEPEAGNPCITEPPPALPPCGGEQCHGIPEATPSLLAPGTATFNGEGNVPSSPPPPAKPAVKKTVKCPKGKTRSKHGKCVKQKGKRKAKNSRTVIRASKDRRAGR